VTEVAARDGWQPRRLRDAVTKLVDGSHNPPPKQDRGRPMLSARNVDQGQIIFDDFRYISDESFETENARTRVSPGDVLLTIVGTIGRSAVVPEGLEPFALQRSVAVLSPKEDLFPKFLAYQLQSPRIQRHFEEHARGTAQKGVYLKTLGETPLLVPSVSEQRVIVAEIEKQFSRLDEAVANLKRVKANLKRYKAAVLKAAVEGRLVPTEAELARREGRGYESGQELVQRILGVRRSQWQGKGKYEEPAQPERAELPELPEGWAWARLDAVTSIKGGITVDKKRKDPTARLVPYLRVANVQRGYLDLEEIKVIDAPEAEIEALRLRPGDILFNEGGDRDKLGRGWIWEGKLAECIHQNHVFRARPLTTELSGKLISWWGNTFGREYFEREGKQTTNLASINLTKLGAFPVPIPPAAEQLRMVQEIERLLSVVVEVDNELQRDAALAEQLRRATLASAFDAERAL
jgi:type I restriction enzyme, S subunit